MDDLTRKQLKAFLDGTLIGPSDKELARQLLATMDRAERAEGALANIVQLSTEPVVQFPPAMKLINAHARAALEEKP